MKFLDPLTVLNVRLFPLDIFCKFSGVIVKSSFKYSKNVFNSVFLFIIGVADNINLIFDFIELSRNKIPYYYKLSQVYTYIQNKNKKDLKD